MYLITALAPSSQYKTVGGVLPGSHLIVYVGNINFHVSH